MAVKVPPIVLSLNALDGHGKTSALLTMPKPLALFHIDPNTEEIVNAALESGELNEGDVTLYPVPYPQSIFSDRDAVQVQARETWDEKFIEPLRTVLEDGDVASIGLDTSTEIFELVMMADHGKTVQVLPEMRTKTNYQFKGLLSALKRSGKHICLLHRLKDHWESKIVEGKDGETEVRNKVQGQYEREGFNKTGFHVNIEACLMFSATRGGTTANRFGLRVHRCLARPSLVTAQMDQAEFWDLDDEGWRWGREKYTDRKGVEQRVRRASVPWLATQVYPTTTVRDWR